MTSTRQIYAARAHSTGKYHWAVGPQATLCSHSGPRRSISNRPATGAEIRNADTSMFCKKCFQNESAIQIARDEADKA